MQRFLEVLLRGKGIGDAHFIIHWGTLHIDVYSQDLGIEYVNDFLIKVSERIQDAIGDPDFLLSAGTTLGICLEWQGEVISFSVETWEVKNEYVDALFSPFDIKLQASP
jgi:hypothetical protein